MSKHYVWPCGYCDKGMTGYRRPDSKPSVIGMARDMVEGLNDRPLRPEVCAECYKSRVVPQLNGRRNNRLTEIKEFIHINKVTGLITDYSLFGHKDVDWLVSEIDRLREALEEIAKPPYKDSDTDSLYRWCRARAQRVLEGED